MIRIGAVVLMVLLLAGCGGPDVREERPEAVARVAAKAWMRTDMDTLIDLSCKRMKKQMEAARTSMEEMASIMQSMGVDMKDVRFDFSKVNFDVTEEEEFTATVHMHGPMTVSIPGRSDDVAEQDMEISLVKEDEAWRICSELN